MVINFLNDKYNNVLGLFVGENEDGSGHYYFCGETDAPAPEGMYEVNVPSFTWAVFSGVQGHSDAEILFHRIYTEWLPAADYDLVSDMEMEVHYKTNNTEYEIWLPVAKRK